jgi:phage recombination protein Bet
MSAQVVLSQNSTELTDEMVGTLIQAGVIPQNTPIAQIKVFAQFCKDKGLSPFAKEVYLLGFGGVYSRIVGIDGFRKIAARTGQLAGCDDAKFDLKSDGTWFTASELIEKKQLPKTATVTVYRNVGGLRVPFTHTAVFSEFTTGKQKWVSMPFQMIAKCSEAFAIRKGFSDEVSGLSIDEEIGAIQDIQVVENEKPKTLPILSPDAKIWDGIKESVENAMNKGEIFTIERVRARYQITDEHFNLLMK